jgi:hypothetical protein
LLQNQTKNRRCSAIGERAYEDNSGFAGTDGAVAGENCHAAATAQLVNLINFVNGAT